MEDGDWVGLSFGEPEAVDGEDSTVEAVIVLRTAAGFCGTAVDAIVYD